MNESITDLPPKAQWKVYADSILEDLSRWGMPVDQVDRLAYGEVLSPLRTKFLNGELKATSPESWRIRIAMRNFKFRPTPDEVGEIVSKVLGVKHQDPEEKDIVRVTQAPLSYVEKERIAREQTESLVEQRREENRLRGLERMCQTRQISMEELVENFTEEIPRAYLRQEMFKGLDGKPDGHAYCMAVLKAMKREVKQSRSGGDTISQVGDLVYNPSS